MIQVSFVFGGFNVPQNEGVLWKLFFQSFTI